MWKAILTAWCLLLAASAPAAPPGAGAPAPARGGAYERLDPRKLADALRALRMNELLQELVGSIPPTAGGEMALAEQKVRLAESSQDPAERQALLKEALDLYQAVAAVQPATENDRWNRYFEARLRIVDLYRARVEPLATRLMYLQGAEEDRQAIVAGTEEPIKVLRDLKREVDQTLLAYRQDPNKANFTVFQRVSAAMRGRVDGVGAYVKLYRGMALPPASGERKTLLTDVVTALGRYADMEEEAEGKYRASLLVAMALRELGQHDTAAAKLATAVSEKAPPEIRLQAMFEIVHNRTEQGKYEQALSEIENFRKAALAILGPGGQLRVDVQATLLRNDLHERQASGEKDPARAKALRAAEQKALLDFLQKYPAPDISEHFMDVVGWKYRDRVEGPVWAWAAALGDANVIPATALLARLRECVPDLDSLLKGTDANAHSESGSAVLAKLRRAVPALVLLGKVDSGAKPAEVLWTRLREDLPGIVLVALARIEKAKDTDDGKSSALRLLGLVSDANDPVSAAYVLKESASLLFTMKRTREAGRQFFQMARAADSNADPNRAFTAAMNAAVCFYNAYQEALRDKTVTADLQEELLAAVEWLTTRYKTYPEVGPWFFILGRRLAEKSQGLGPGTPEWATMLRRAVEELEKTPEDLPESPDARFRALEIRLRLLRETPKDANAAAEARDKMQRFADDARKALASTQDQALVEQWTDWGSRAAVGVIQVRHEFLKDASALGDLPGVLALWKGAAVAKEAMDWEIRMLVESAGPGKIAEAIAKVDAFRAQYPQEADGLIRQVVVRIQDRIRTLRRGTSKEAQDELASLRRSYLDFSKELYGRSMKAADPNQAYVPRQMYADALCEAGDGAQGLKLWEQCAAEDARKREARGRLLHEDANRRVAAAQAARRNDKELERAVADYRRLLQEKKVDPSETQAPSLEAALKAMQEAPTPEVRDQRMAEVTYRLVEAHKELAAALEKQTPEDALNVLGLARASRLLKQYAKSMDHYKRLRGIDRQSHGEFYWEVQLELCQTAREGFPADQNQMKQLVQYIQNLRNQEPAMGGAANLFNQIEFDAKKAYE